MNLSVTQKHIHFFAENGFIELEEIISTAEAAVLCSAIDALLEKRMKKIIDMHTPVELFKSGRDLWKHSPVIAKKSMSRSFAALMASLTLAKGVRLAYDQAIRTTKQPGEIFPFPCPLQEVSCFQPLLGGMLLRLKDDPNAPDFLPKKIGSALFFQASVPLPWNAFTQTQDQSFFLLAYAPENCLYVLEPKDPHTHDLKKEGYGFGDPIKTPLLYK